MGSQAGQPPQAAQASTMQPSPTSATSQTQNAISEAASGQQMKNNQMLQQAISGIAQQFAKAVQTPIQTANPTPLISAQYQTPQLTQARPLSQISIPQ